MPASCPVSMAIANDRAASRPSGCANQRENRGGFGSPGGSRSRCAALARGVGARTTHGRSGPRIEFRGGPGGGSKSPSAASIGAPRTAPRGASGPRRGRDGAGGRGGRHDGAARAARREADAEAIELAAEGVDGEPSIGEELSLQCVPASLRIRPSARPRCVPRRGRGGRAQRLPFAPASRGGEGRSATRLEAGLGGERFAAIRLEARDSTPRGLPPRSYDRGDGDQRFRADSRREVARVSSSRALSSLPCLRRTAA